MEDIHKMRELKLDVYSLYPDIKAAGPYDYAILVDELNVGAFACESYGAQVVNRSTGDRAEVPHITIIATRIAQLMELLVRNLVGPVHLEDVVEDWL